MKNTTIPIQLDLILKNRVRRFRFLMRNNRTEDALALADEFFEWFDPNFQNNLNEEILYYTDDLL